MSERPFNQEAVVNNVPCIEEFPFPNKPRLRLYAFGPGADGLDWNLGGLWRGNGTSQHPGLRETFARVERLADRHGVKNLLVPSVQEFNAVVCSPSDMVRTRQSTCGTLTAHGGRFVDGVLVPPGFASWQASADCPTILAASDEKALTAHAGFKSLCDVRQLTLGKKSRSHMSVVDASIQKLGGDPASVQVFIVSGIAPEHYGHPANHPQYGRENGELFRYCCWLQKEFNKEASCAYEDRGEYKFNLHEMIRAQFIQQGVPAGNIRISRNSEGKTVDTYSDTDENGRFIWHSQRRDRTPKRNALLFVNAA